MVFDAILGFIVAIPNFILNDISGIGVLYIPEGTFLWWKDVFVTLTYVFPVWGLTPILAISFAIKLFEIVWSLINRVKGIAWASN